MSAAECSTRWQLGGSVLTVDSSIPVAKVNPVEEGATLHAE